MIRRILLDVHIWSHLAFYYCWLYVFFPPLEMARMRKRVWRTPVTVYSQGLIRESMPGPGRTLTQARRPSATAVRDAEPLPTSLRTSRYCGKAIDCLRRHCCYRLLTAFEGAHCCSASSWFVFGLSRVDNFLAITSVRWWRWTCVERPTGHESEEEIILTLTR